MAGVTIRSAALPDGSVVSYAASGADSADPLLLLHAWGEGPRSFDRLMPLLPPGVRALAPAAGGPGAHGQPTLDSMAAAALAFMDAVGVSSAWVLGSSSGGYVAQQLAASTPERVSGLILVGAPRTLRGRAPFADEVEALRDPVPAEWVRASLAWFPMRQAVPERYIADRVADGARIPARVWRETLEALCTAAPPTERGRIACPTLLLWGEDDALLPRAEQERLAAAIPGSRLLTLADTGHLVLWERPERIAAELTAFLAQRA